MSNWKGLAVAGALAMAVVLAPTQTASAEFKPPRAPSRVVYVENHAGRLWPIHRAAETLDNHSRLNLKVVRKCPRGKPCIRVYSGNPGGRGVIGGTTWQGSWAPIVVLSRQWGRRVSYHRRLTLACHEIGHAVGLPHSSSRSSCLYPNNTSAVADHPSKKDYQDLRRLYG